MSDNFLFFFNKKKRHENIVSFFVEKKKRHKNVYEIYKMEDYMPKDKFSIIHVAGNVVLLAGITLWLNSKIKTSDSRIEDLENIIALQEQRLLEIEKLLSKGNPTIKKVRFDSATSSDDQEVSKETIVIEEDE